MAMNNTTANINNAIASATTTSTNNLLADITTWKETALNLSRILSEQTDIVNLLNKKLIELSKENAELRSKVEMVENKIKNDVVTKIAFYDCCQFCYNILYIEGEVKLQDLPNDMQKEFGYHCTTHSVKCEPVLQDRIIEFGYNLGYIEIEILNKDSIPYNKDLCNIKQFINAYNEFVKYYL